MADEPTPELFESERAELDRLHLSVWRSQVGHKTAGYAPNASQQAYHPAYAASRLQQLENVVGSLMAILLVHHRIDRKELFELIGHAYTAQIQDMELQAIVHNVAYRLYPYSRQARQPNVEQSDGHVREEGGTGSGEG